VNRLLASALLVPALLAASVAQAGGKKPAPTLNVNVVSAPAARTSLGDLGKPIGEVLARDPQNPINATDSTRFEIPENRVLALDWVGGRAVFDQNLPVGARYTLLIQEDGGISVPIAFAEANGNVIEFGAPVPMVLGGGNGTFLFAVLGSFGGATVSSVNYGFSGRLLPR